MNAISAEKPGHLPPMDVEYVEDLIHSGLRNARSAPASFSYKVRGKLQLEEAA